MYIYLAPLREITSQIPKFILHIKPQTSLPLMHFNFASLREITSPIRNFILHIKPQTSLPLMHFNLASLPARMLRSDGREI